MSNILVLCFKFCGLLRISKLYTYLFVLGNLGDTLKSWRMEDAIMVVRRCQIQGDEKRRKIEEAITQCIYSHLGDGYQLLDIFLGYYFHLPNINSNKWACSTIVTQVLMESGVFKKDFPSVNNYSPGNFDQKTFEFQLEEGISFGPELKLTQTHWDTFKLKFAILKTTLKNFKK